MSDFAAIEGNPEDNTDNADLFSRVDGVYMASGRNLPRSQMAQATTQTEASKICSSYNGPKIASCQRAENAAWTTICEEIKTLTWNLILRDEI